MLEHELLPDGDWSAQCWEVIFYQLVKENQLEKRCVELNRSRLLVLETLRE